MAVAACFAMSAAYGQAAAGGAPRPDPPGDQRYTEPGDPNSYIVGKDAVKRYLTIAEECGKATLAVAELRR